MLTQVLYSMAFDPFSFLLPIVPYIPIIAILTAIGGLAFTILSYQKSGKKTLLEAEDRTADKIDKAKTEVKEFIASSIALVDEKVIHVAKVVEGKTQEIKDVKDAVDDIEKALILLDKAMAIIDAKLPEFDIMKKDFYKLKSTVETHMALTRASSMFKNTEERDEANG